MIAVPTLEARLKKPLRSFAVAARWATLIVGALVVLVPVATMIVAGLNGSNAGEVNPFAFPSHIRFANFPSAWHIGQFGGYLLNTAVYCAAIVTGVVVLSTLAGYALACLSLPLSRALTVFFLLGIMLPFQSVMIPQYFLMRSLHLLNSYWSFVIPGIAFGLGFGIFVMRTFFLSLPAEVAESARMDGASEGVVLVRVMLPMARSGILTLVVFQFLYTWNAFLMPLILVQGSNYRPVSLGLIFFQGSYITNESLLAAGAAIVSAPILLVYLALQRYFIRGIVAGALK